jgi:hypothetical protein
VLRYPVTGPPLGRDRKGLLRGFLGEIDVTEEADQGRQDAAPLAPENRRSCSARCGLRPL